MRAARKDARRAELQIRQLERSIERLTALEATLHGQMAASATDHAALTDLQADLQRAGEEREELEGSWLRLSESLEGE